MENYNYQENNKNKRFDKAIEVSAKLFLEQGIDEVKMTDIANESGIGVATLYRYFGTKTGIAIAAMTYMWNDLKSMFSGIFESDIFLKQSGLKQLKDLMRMFVVLYQAHPRFMKLLAEFDLLIAREKVPKTALREYDHSVIDFYPVVEKAYITGLSDGTIRDDIDFRLFYLSHAHALMELSKKLIQGELLPSDDFSAAEKELEMLIDAAVAYIRKE
ncbi:MAG: TetR/AcrR family transcriptional regulator [Ruminococcus sp.]|nr:TetR/AcrR family transcriptional regulator [Ruminococcus sp.]